MTLSPIRSRNFPISVVAGLLAALTWASPLPAEPPISGAVEQQIEAHLKAYPGGKQINANQISYANGAFIMTFVREQGTQAGANCPAGWFCFYEGKNYGYPRGQLSSCTWQDLAWFGWSDRTDSVHYNASSGTTYFWNHQTQESHAYDKILFRFGSTNRTDSDVSPYLNMADHVERLC